MGKVITMGQMVKMIKRSPNKYRIGATKDIDQRMQSYSREIRGFNRKRVSIVKVHGNASLRNKEDKLLGPLSCRHPYNQHKSSNIPGNVRGGYVYSIKM